MRVFLRSAMLMSLALLMNACVTQLVTTPTQVATQTASQSTQTATQTAGQAAQVAIPGGDEKQDLSSNTPAVPQSRAGFLRSEAGAVPDYRLDQILDNEAAVKKTSRSDR